MDVPYDPACPLLIDSGDESLVSDDENIEKKYGDLLSKRMDGHYYTSEKNTVFGKKHQSEARFVPAFEDDNEELLNYCLRESGILTDDEEEVKSDLAKEYDNVSDVGNEHNAEMSSKEDIDSEVAAKSNEEEIAAVEQCTESDRKYSKKKKKKHRLKEEYGESGGRRGRDSSSETEKKCKKDSSKKDKKDKNYTKVLDGKKRGRKIEAKASNSSKSDDLDDDELFATLGENDDTFPLSKVGHDLDIEIESNQKRSKDMSKKNGKEKHQRERSKSKHRKEKVGDIKEEKKSKKKRQRSRSNQRRSKSSESDVPEKRRKRKRKHRDSSSEKDKKRNEKKKSIHEKKRKHEYDKDERDKKDKKRKRHHDRDSERKPSHHKREKKVKKDSEKLNEKSHSHHEASHTNKNNVEKSKNYRSESREAKKKELRQKEELTKHEKIQKDHHKEHKKQQRESMGSKRQSIEEVGRNEKKCVKLNSVIGKSYVHNEAIQLVSEEETDIKTPHETVGNEDEHIPVQDHAEGSAPKETEEVTLMADTDSEFEKTTSSERELEKENSDSNISLPDIPDIIKTDDAVDDDETIQEDIDSKQSDENRDDKENSKGCNEEHDSSAEVCKTESTEENEVIMPSPTCSQPSSTSLSQEVMDPTVIQGIKEIEKRPFKLFSQEETNKLHKELISKDEQGEMMEEKGAIEEQSESLDKMKNDLREEVMIKGEECLTTVGDELQNKNEIPRSDEISLSEPKCAQRSKDDLFDDIFAQEDSEGKNDNDIAKMYEVDSTSPKMISFKKQKSLVDQSAVVLNAKETTILPQVSETAAAMLEDDGGMDAEQSLESPEGRSPQSSAIPGLEPVGIPGLESNKAMENRDAFRSDVQSTASSRIPLLFEDHPSIDKSGTIPSVIELSPLQKTVNKRKQPYTPPEEFTREAKISKSGIFTEHFEGSDSPYNPEDLSPIDMGLTPSDVSNIQREALKGTVQLKLKDPFSGFENPTWQKILEAKSKHEAKRKRGKSNDSNNRSKERISKEEARSSKQDKLVSVLVRQSKVEKECKEVLKLYYKSREITKDEYKDILRKAVPQVTMSNSPIIPEKIRSLMKKFVCKCKGQRLMSGHTHPEKKKKHRVRKTESLHHELTFAGEKRFRYLNPDLPMPPV